MMKKISAIIIGIILSASAFSQRPTATLQQVNDFMKSTLYIVTDENPISEYNAAVKIGIEKNWKITKYQFINYTEFEAKRMDPKNAFLVVTEATFEQDANDVKYDFVSILVGGEYKTVNEMPEICTFPLKYTEADDETAMYKLPTIIGFFNKHIPNIQKNAKLLKDRKYTFYTKQKKNVKKSTLYLVADEQLADLNDEKKIKPFYTGKVTMTGREEIGNFIEKNMPNVAFLHKIGAPTEKIEPNSRCYIIIMGTDFTLYYFGYHKITSSAQNAILAKELKKISAFSK